MNKKGKIQFSRFGGISPVKQKGYDPSMPWSHSPPTTKGIYCFIHPYYEPFLLGGDDYSGIEAKHSKFEYVKDKNGNKIEVEYGESKLIKKYDADGNITSAEYIDDKIGITSNNWMKGSWKHTDIKTGKSYWIKPKKPKIFTHTGELWHHLGHNLKPYDIIKEKGAWVLTDYKAFEKAFSKEKSNYISQFTTMKKEIFNAEDYTTKTSKNPFNCNICIDLLEVFIEKIK